MSSQIFIRGYVFEKEAKEMIQPLRQNTIQLLKVVLFILATLFVLIIWGGLTGARDLELGI